MVEGLGFGRRRLVAKVVLENWKLKRPEDKKFTFNELLFVIQEMLEEEGKEYLQGKGTALKGHHIFRMFVKHLLYRNLANYDSMVLITAEKGVGKSSAAIMMAREWCRLIGIRFDPARHIAYSGADVMNKIDALKKFEPLIADEAVRFACLTGNTLINTPAGKIPIKELEGKNNFEVYSFNEKTKKKEIKIAQNCLKVKKDIVFEIQTDDGKKIKATKEHKFLTSDGWKRLEELKEGDDLIGI